MNKNELIGAVAESSGLSRNDATKAVESVFDTITATLAKGGEVRLVGFGMGGWFLSTGIGNNLSGIFAGYVSGEGGMTTASALGGYTFGFWALIVSGGILLLVSPLLNRFMHGVK